MVVAIGHCTRTRSLDHVCIPTQLLESNDRMDPKGWWISEKLDGVRAYWTGRQFLSRNGNTYCAPDWFRKCLPKMELDGELWCGRKKFNTTVSVCKTDSSKRWKQDRVVYMVCGGYHLYVCDCGG
jgi:DNA ligase 1